MMKPIPILSFVIGIFFGIVLFNGLMSLRPVFAEEKAKTKPVITEEELDKKLTEILESQAQFKKKIEEIKERTHALRVMSSQ